MISTSASYSESLRFASRSEHRLSWASFFFWFSATKKCMFMLTVTSIFLPGHMRCVANLDTWRLDISSLNNSFDVAHVAGIVIVHSYACIIWIALLFMDPRTLLTLFILVRHTSQYYRMVWLHRPILLKTCKGIIYIYRDRFPKRWTLLSPR
jgi:hypothetical protein